MLFFVFCHLNSLNRLVAPSLASRGKDGFVASTSSNSPKNAGYYVTPYSSFSPSVQLPDEFSAEHLSRLRPKTGLFVRS